MGAFVQLEAHLTKLLSIPVLTTRCADWRLCAMFPWRSVMCLILGWEDGVDRPSRRRGFGQLQTFYGQVCVVRYRPPVINLKPTSIRLGHSHGP
jgi:hypothetical protein